MRQPLASAHKRIEVAMFAPTPRFQMTKLPIIVALAVLGIVGIVVGGRAYMASKSSSAADAPRSTTQRSPAAVVRTAPATTGSIRSVFSYAGSIQATDQVNLVPKTSGIIQSMPVEVGTRVRAGQVLARLDPGPLTDQLAQAQAGYDQAQAKLQQILAQGRP